MFNIEYYALVDSSCVPADHWVSEYTVIKLTQTALDCTLVTRCDIHPQGTSKRES